MGTSERVDLGRAELPLRAVGLAIWAFVGVPPLLASPRLPWVLAWLAYGLAFAATTLRRLRHPVIWLLLLVQSLVALALPSLGVRGSEGVMLAVVSAEAAAVLPPRESLAWALGQCVALLALVVPRDPPRTALEIVGAYSTFAAFALLLTHLREREVRARRDLARAHAELVGLQGLLVEGSLAGERLRISRELHDTVGHHLTVLSIQLDLASRLTEGRAAEVVRASHAVSKQMLSEVRDVVSALREEGAVQLGTSLRALAAGVPRPAVHCDADEALRVEDPAAAHALFRCAQEAVTNAVRHADARNVWLAARVEGDAVEVRVRDDGRGARLAGLRANGGLRGMRERAESVGGAVEFETAPGRGFEVRVRVPAGRRA